VKMLSEFWCQIQLNLFPHVEEVLGQPLSEKLEQLVSILEVVRVEEHVLPAWSQWMGRKRLDRGKMARAFVA